MTRVAELAGVSVTTVSHVLNKTRPVAAETERAVLEAVAKVGYRLPAGQDWATGRTMTIGLAMSAMTNPYFGALVQAMDQSARGEGYSMLLADTDDDPAGEMRAMTDLLSRGVAGGILAPSADPSDALAYAHALAVPVALVDRLLPVDVDQVGAENREATAGLVEHLAVRHQRIAMITGKRGLATTEERVEGFRAGMRRARRRVDESLILDGESDAGAAARAVTEALRHQRPPTAIVVGNNIMTIGVMRALRGRGLEVPGDLALAVFDDFEWADLFHPRLTTIAQPVDAIGAQAVELITSRIADPRLPPRRIRMQSTFVHRDSCGCG
jgi:LacI family transcriptional regulator